MPELVAALGEGRDVPTPLLHEAFLYAVPHDRRQNVLEPDAVRDVAVGFHLSQLGIDNGLQSMRRSDVTGGLERSNQVAAEHGIERRIGEGCTYGRGLSLAEIRKRRIRPEGRCEGPGGNFLLAMAHERERHDAGLIGEERAVQRRGRWGCCRRPAWGRRGRW